MQSLFVCDLCGNVDVKDLAYEDHDFFQGPPAPWRCRGCQGIPTGLIEPPLVKYDPTRHDVINRAKFGLTISMG